MLLGRGRGFINNQFVKEVQYVLTNGATLPARALLNDNTNVILKYYRKDIGKLVLFNEYFAINWLNVLTCLCHNLVYV